MPGVQIVSYSSQHDTLGFLHIVGEVENTGSRPVSMVEVTIKFYDTDDHIVVQRSMPTTARVIPPGGRSPFDVMFDNPLSVHRYELDVVGTEGPEETVSGLEVLSHESEIESAGFLQVFNVTGTLKNTTGKPVRFVKVIVTLYDEAGTVIGTSFVYARPNEVMVDETTSFKVIVRSFQPIARYELMVEGERTE